MTRSHDVSQLTTAELELTRRQLRANLALIAPGSPAHVPILAQASATTARTFPARPRHATRRASCFFDERYSRHEPRAIPAVSTAMAGPARPSTTKS